MGGKGSGRLRNPPNIKEMLKEILPVGEILEDDEMNMYRSLIDIYLGDFDANELTASDFDDIQGLAMNKILEHRLFKSAKGNASAQINIASAVEKLRKQNKDHKESLSARRKDRISPNELKGFSIVDIAVAYDEQKRHDLEERVKKMNKAIGKVNECRKDYRGNRDDVDAQNVEEG